MNINLKELEKRFHADGYQLGMKAVQEGGRGEALMSAVQQMHLLVDELIAYFTQYAELQGQVPGCRKGCFWCCYQPVFALSYELDSLHEHLKSNFTTNDLQAVYVRAASKRSNLKGLTGEALLNSKVACPLLMNDSCIAYAARPVACRIYLSSDVGTCKQFYREPGKKDAVPALLVFPMRMGRLINEGFRAALKSSGFQAEEYRIEEFNNRAVL